MEFCPECGTKNDEFSSNCANCGAALANARPAKEMAPMTQSVSEPVRAPDAASIFCGECGAKNDAGVSFCGSCGKSLSGTAPVQTTPQYQPQQTPQYQQPLYQSPQSGYQQGYQQGYQPQAGYQSTGGYYPGRLPMNFYHPRMKSVGLAMIVSILLPGFAYMYTDQVGKGILYLLITYITYGFGIGLFIHIYMIYAGKKEVDRYNYNLFMSSQGAGY